jgi:WD40 repeat protein
MPPKKQLPQENLDVIKRWIDGGAGWDAAVFDEPPTPRMVSLQAPAASYQSVLAVAISPDGKTAASARSNSISLLALPADPVTVTGQLIGHTEPVQSLSWFQDGTRIASGGYQRIIIWNAAEKTIVREIKADLIGDITGLTVTPDGASIFAADGLPGGAGFLHHIDLASGKVVKTWKAHEDTIYSLRTSPDGKLLLSASADKNVRIWDTAKLTQVASLEGHTNHVLSATFNKDATRVASAGADGEVKIWDVANREQIIVLRRGKAVFTSLDWTAGDLLIATTDKGAVSIYSEFKVHDGAQSSAGTKERKLNAVSETLNAVAATPDGTKIFGAGFDGNVHVWDVKSGASTPVKWNTQP